MSHETRFGILVLQSDPWPDIVERVQRYERLGFDAVWIADHFALPWDPAQPWFEGWTVLAGLATVTSRIRLGPLVSHVVYRNPAVLARQALTVDHLSGGRLNLGLGAGASPRDAPMTGVDWWSPAERVGRFRDAVEIVDRLLCDEETTYRGRYYRVTGATMNPGPVQRPRPPLTIAASGPVMVKLAARYADVWNTEGSFEELFRIDAAPAEVYRLTRERNELLSEHAAALGRDPAAITRSFLAGYGAAPEDPWASSEAFHDLVGRYREIGFSEFVFPEPSAGESDVFERIVADVITSAAIA
ncbi:MAG: LLM class flavin-dependent oxidoreductase [Thermomicrobiales bacterium]